MNAFDQYLRRYAEAEAALAAGVTGNYAHALVVPAHRESSDLLDGFRLAARRAPGRVLCVVVVNGRDSDPAAVHADNARLLGDLRAATRSSRRLGSDHVVFGDAGDFDLVVIDRASGGLRFGDKDGVGLARKIGSDFAVAMAALGRIEATICWTDADAVLPPDYFAASAEADIGVVVVHPFRHVVSGDAAVDEATFLYEIWLRYYVLGLAWARSPYAAHSIGSTFAFAPSAYAAVRGVPRRRAGEDFYFLNKVAKIGAVVRGRTGSIRLSSRVSDRVPFGTGARVQALVRGSEELSFYSPQCFAALRELIEAFGECAATGDARALTGRLDALEHSVRVAVSSQFEQWGASKVIGALMQQYKTPALRLRAVHSWFDAFRTLKTIHALRSVFPNVSWDVALGTAPFSPVDGRVLGSRRLERIGDVLFEREKELASRAGPTEARPSSEER